MPQLTWLITGCSSGIGQDLAYAVLSRGDKVVATARSPVSRLSDLEKAGAATLELDVTAEQHVLDTAVEKAIGFYSGIDVLVCNAGYGQMTLAEDATPEIWSNQLNVNFFGTVNMVKAILPHFRAKKSGKIAFSNSLYGHVGVISGAPYAVSKHAVAAYAKCLEKEVASLGIQPIVFDIGFVRNEVVSRMVFTPPGHQDYAEGYAALAKMADGVPGNQPGDQKLCVERMIDVVKSEGMAAGKPVPAAVPLGSDAYLTVKRRAEAMLKACEEWEALSRSIDFPGPRQGFFADVEFHE